ncbi:hypothetical protein [Wolbachia endosymbiont of Dirofilaria (Dirofilaria) immitis]|uniref:hypothetical protein n=1 Tax=Wolbachia endosymbiont of Dirofilaria (Dirofilaria) immitis TaxID=1812115 RepID=UPI0015895B2E|nr:hypothetical protein [Wolbachia endosymbiont of Dirofilaria (Dirofilaria) immitis]QKX02011.1 hypothetical protein GOY12_00105 [Wolbachia endosymbiont of Dirofilaria (Dirofilaria) immitis]
MLDKIRKLWKAICSTIKGKVESPYALMVEESSSNKTALKANKKKQEEYLTSLNNKRVSGDNSDITVKEEFPSDLSTQNTSELTLDKSERSIILDNDEAWNKFFLLQNNLSTNITNQKPFARGKNKYNGRDITGKIAEQIKREISKSIANNTIGSIRLKEAKRENNLVYPSIRVTLNDSEKEVNVTKLLSGNICKKYNVKTITFCYPNQKKTRGACCYINDSGKRVYEVINGSYQMTIKWYAGEKECNIKININDDGSIRLIKSNSITEEQLRANKEVKVGKKCEAKFLYEALASQLPQLQQKSSELVKILHHPSTNVTGVDKPQEHQAPVSQRCIYPLN